MQPQTSLRIRYHNRTKVLLCYLLAWGLALLLPLLALYALYPYKLAGSAPTLPDGLATLSVALPQTAREALAAAGAELAQSDLQMALQARDFVWRWTVGGVVLLAWALSLLLQLLWRGRYVRPGQGARAALRAVHTYRLTLLSIAGVNLLAAFALFAFGVRQVAGRTAWDYLIYFGGFVLIPLAAAVCFRLAAPPAISGRRAFFRRL